MWQFLYSFIAIPLFWFGIQVMRLFNRKIRRGIRGRRKSAKKLDTYLTRNAERRHVWVHVSSMGEFEQAKPIIEALKEARPDLHVAVTFFSPSGYENSARYRGADLVLYLPFDTRRAAARFLGALRPALAVFVRYDLWPNHLWTSGRLGIPVVLTNGTMRASSPRLLPGIRAFHRSLFNTMRAILTVSQEDAVQFERFGAKRPEIRVIGDTRFDRVEMRARTAREQLLLPAAITEGKTIVVAGSTWSEDEEILLPVVYTLLKFRPSLLFVIVPHEPTIDHLETLEYKIGAKAGHIRFSYLHRYAGEQIILVDSIGILLPLYASAHVAFVGGGFKSNVHNTLEPAAYGIPVLYGPRIQNSQEARQLADSGGGAIVNDKRMLYKTLRRLVQDEQLRAAIGDKAGAFVHSRAGATEQIVRHLLDALPSAG